MNISNENPDSVTVICIIRHGETDWNAAGRLQGCEDTELNNEGRKQAFELACYLKTAKWDTIYSSPLKRAFETAQIISGQSSFEKININDNLKERNYGEASGLFPNERRNRFPDGLIPGQEDFEHLRLRAFNALLKIAEENKGQRIIIVSHGALINSILYTLSNGEFGSFKTRLKNGCINILKYYGTDWRVKFYNKTVDELNDINFYVNK